jgi:hypothetical protein
MDENKNKNLNASTNNSQTLDSTLNMLNGATGVQNGLIQTALDTKENDVSSRRGQHQKKITQLQNKYTASMTPRINYHFDRQLRLEEIISEALQLCEGSLDDFPNCGSIRTIQTSSKDSIRKQ